MAEKYYLDALNYNKSPRLTALIDYELAKLYQRVKNWQKAIEHYEKILDNDDNNAEMHFQLGEVYYQLGELPRARSEWRRTVRIDPQHRGALLRLYN